MRVRRGVLVLPVLVLALTMTPGHARQQAVCVLSGTVALSAPANLLTTDKGTGSFSPSSLLRCTGAVSGNGGGAAGGFSFCQHNLGSGNIACHPQGNNGPTKPLDPLYDTTNRTPFKIAAHAKGSASFSGFTGGVSCSLSFEGHAYSTVAELKIQSFVCSNGFKATQLRNAVATAIPLITSVSGCPAGPGNLKACFKSLLFVGAIVVSGP